MAWAFVQVAWNDATASGGAITATLGVNSTAGNSIVVNTKANSSSTGVTSVAHNSQNLTQRDIITNAADAWQERFFTIDNITGGATTVTYTPAANVAFRGIMAAEYSGLRTTGSYARGSWRRQSPSVTATDGTTSNTVDTTGDATPYLQLGVCFAYNGTATPAAGTGQTSRGTGILFGSGNDQRLTDRNRATGSATEAATFTMSTTSDITYTGQLILLEPAAAGGAFAPRLSLLGVGR